MKQICVNNYSMFGVEKCLFYPEDGDSKCFINVNVSIMHNMEILHGH